MTDQYKYPYPNRIDLFFFMGQSNMAGRGITCERWPQKAPALTEHAAFEYRAVTAPDRLVPLEEPFGRTENRPDGINDGVMKTGSMVTAFANACYQQTGVPMVAVSASKGGSSILQWQPGTPFLLDTQSRLEAARHFLEENGISVRHTFMVWCQGETDGDHNMPGSTYQAYFGALWGKMKELGAEHCFLIQIGKYNGCSDISYQEIRKAQEKLPELFPDVTLVSDDFASMKERGLMKDDFHYYQAAYNEVGEAAGRAAGAWIKKLTGSTAV